MYFSKDTYIARRNELAQLVGEGLILLPGNGYAAYNYPDNTYPFRQDSTFLYFAGINEPNLVLLIDTQSGVSTLFGDNPTIMHTVWMGAQDTLQDFQEVNGVDLLMPLDALQGILETATTKGRVIHYLPPYRGKGTLQIAAWLNESPLHVEMESSLELIEAVVAMRSIKSAEEIALIEQALAVSADMHLHIMKNAKAGITEQQLVADAWQIALSRGTTMGYTPIISTAGQILHNHHYGNTLAEGQLLLADAGVELPGGYCSDITRTTPVNGKFNSRQRDIYQLVLDVLETATGNLKPQTSYRTIHLQAALQIAEGLKQLGLMKGDMQDAVESGAHALFFPHGLGHMLGMDVHDMENLGEDYVGYTEDIERSTQFGLRSLRLAKPLEAGHVLTVEPGIYFIPALTELWKAEGLHNEFLNFDAIESYYDFGGVRLEDNVLITEEGARVLGVAIPKSIEELEGLQ